MAIESSVPLRHRSQAIHVASLPLNVGFIAAGAISFRVFSLPHHISNQTESPLPKRGGGSKAFSYHHMLPCVRPSEPMWYDGRIESQFSFTYPLHLNTPQNSRDMRRDPGNKERLLHLITCRSCTPLPACTDGVMVTSYLPMTGTRYGPEFDSRSMHFFHLEDTR